MSQNASTPSEEIRKGLAGVVVDTTAISKVDPATNSLLYRGYRVQDLAAQCSIEEVACLLWDGDLPTAERLAEFSAAERAGRALTDQTRAVIDALPTDAHPMDVLRTAVSVVAAADPDAADSSPEADLRKAQRLFAAIPAMIAYDQRRRRGLDVIPPREDLGFSRNLLWMTFGEEPGDLETEVLDQSMILYAEHSFNASTFTVRVVTSTLSDLGSAVVAGIAALKGPLHGGANEAVMDTITEIGVDRPGIAERARQWLNEALASRRKIMGFGHRVYRNGDSRVPTMKAALERLARDRGREDLLELYVALESAMAEAKGIKPNLDYPSGPAYHLLGFDTAQFTPLFVASRVIGWTAHAREQRAANALIRPLSAYDGPTLREVVPLQNR